MKLLLGWIPSSRCSFIVSNPMLLLYWSTSSSSSNFALFIRNSLTDSTTHSQSDLFLLLFKHNKNFFFIGFWIVNWNQFWKLILHYKSYSSLNKMSFSVTIASSSICYHVTMYVYVTVDSEIAILSDWQDDINTTVTRCLCVLTYEILSTVVHFTWTLANSTKISWGIYIRNIFCCCFCFPILKPWKIWILLSSLQNHFNAYCLTWVSSGLAVKCYENSPNETWHYKKFTLN